MRRLLVFFLITALLISLTGCVSYLGSEIVNVKGFGDNRYIDHNGVRYHIVPEESQKGGYWYPRNTGGRYIGFAKEKFYKWTVVTKFFFFDNGQGVSYIHGSPYYYFPEGIYGFPSMELDNIDALILDYTNDWGKPGKEISDREIIKAFWELQSQEAVSADTDFKIGEAGYFEDITILNREFNIVRPFLITYNEDGAWIPNFGSPGYKIVLIPDDLYKRIIELSY